MRVAGCMLFVLAGLIGTASGAAVRAAEAPHEAAHQRGVFVVEAMRDGLAEQAFGKLVSERSTDSDIRAFADRMMRDHKKANSELAAIARRNQIQVPTDLDPAQNAALDDLEQRTGTDFDAAYARHMVHTHSDAITLFTQASQDSNADVAAFAKRMLPKLRAHKAMADRLATSRVRDSKRPSNLR